MLKKQPVTTQKKASSGSVSFVMLAGDEGAVLVQLSRRTVIKRWFAASPDAQHTRAMEEALLAAPGAPITLLVDMMDQSYIQQTLPPISRFSLSKIIRRRMDKDFSPADIKGFIVLGRDTKGRKDWNYMMVSLVNPPLLQQWLTFLLERSNPFKGLGLVPMESRRFILALDAALHPSENKKKGPSTEWQVLVSHQKVGGFRQIVLRNSQLAFTRMAQPIGESLPGVIAGNIEQELTNTLEYLKRMGLQDSASLSVIIVAAEDIRPFIDPGRINARYVNFVTPLEVANLLALRDAAQELDKFGDVVIASFIGAARKIILPLQTQYSQKLHMFSLYIKSTKIAATLAALSILCCISMSAYDIYTLRNDIDEIARKHTTLQTQLDTIKAQTKILPIQIDLLSDVVSTVLYLDKANYSALNSIQKFAGTLQKSAVVTSLNWSLSNPLTFTKGEPRDFIQLYTELHLKTPKEPRKDYIDAAQNLMDRIQEKYSNFNVTHSDLPGLIADTQVFKTVVGAGDTTNPDTSGGAAQIENVKVTIKGPTGPEGASNGR